LAESVPVRSGDVEFFVEVSEMADVQTIGLDEAFSFDGGRETVQAIAEQLTDAWEKVRSSETSVEFGLKLTAKSGKLTSLIVEGGEETSLRVALTWKSES
jgi:Trypsin-co-occurring domain 1